MFLLSDLYLLQSLVLLSKIVSEYDGLVVSSLW